MAKKRTVKRRKKTQAKSIGLSPAEAKAVDPEREKKVIGDALRLLGWGRQWHELPELISRMADRPALSEVRRILRDNKDSIDSQRSADG